MYAQFVIYWYLYRIIGTTLCDSEQCVDLKWAHRILPPQRREYLLNLLMILSSFLSSYIICGALSVTGLPEVFSKISSKERTKLDRLGWLVLTPLAPIMLMAQKAYNEMRLITFRYASLK